TPPKTQAALLEAMQERQVTIGGRRHPLPAPFFVLATQNPIEQEGTYTLPEAQQDRFMFKVFVKYPSYDEEYRVADVTTSDHVAEVAEVLSGEDLAPLQHLVRKVPAPPHVIHYALRLVRSTRVHEADGVPEFIREWVSWGSGPRGVQYLLLGAKARTVLNGRFSVTTDDIKAVVHPVLRHRVIPNFSADSAGMTTDKILDQLLKETPERHDDDAIAPAWERTMM
ncbi:MAG TPA: MoxR family ATPase, partial [Planctomycetaceae bacterium]|nr:MoxR family ATPase [Planctomycetaceae bacterium]